MDINSNLLKHAICVNCFNEGILAQKGGSVAMLSNNGKKFKNKAINEACYQLGIKR